MERDPMMLCVIIIFRVKFILNNFCLFMECLTSWVKLLWNKQLNKNDELQNIILEYQYQMGPLHKVANELKDDLESCQEKLDGCTVKHVGISLLKEKDHILSLIKQNQDNMEIIYDRIRDVKEYQMAKDFNLKLYETNNKVLATVGSESTPNIDEMKKQQEAIKAKFVNQSDTTSKIQPKQVDNRLYDRMWEDHLKNKIVEPTHQEVHYDATPMRMESPQVHVKSNKMKEKKQKREPVILRAWE